MKHIKLYFACLLMTAFSIGQVWAADVTYTFTTKSWAATSGGSAANWTSGQDGAGFSNNGIQVTTAASGANGTSPISFTNVTKVVCTYNTNASKGKGTIDVQVGTNAAKSVDWAYSGSASGTSANFTATVDYATAETGNVKITLNTSTNSIYLVSVTITTQSSNPEVSVSPASWDFGTVHASDAASKVFSVSGSNLTAGDLTLTVPAGFSVSPSSIAVNGTLDATNVTVSKNTSDVDDYEGNLEITGGGLENAKTVALTMTVDADPAPTGTFELFSGDLAEGDYVITHASANAIKAEINSDRFAAIEVSPSANIITNPDESIVWHIAQSGGYWTIYNVAADKYAASTGAKNKGALLDDGTDDKALWSLSGTYDFINKQNTASSVNATLRYNSQNALNTSWACYASGTGSALVLYKKQVAGQPATPEFSVAGGTYAGTQSVTLACTTDGATIYYTTDGTTPDNNSTEYTGAISVSASQTINAIAYVGSDASSVASAEYTILTPQTTMDQIFAVASADEGAAKSIAITFNNWIVSGAKGNTAYVTDGTKGFIVYYSGHGFAEGDILSGTAIFTIKLYNGAAELTAKLSGTVSTSTGGTATLNVLDADAISTLSGINTGSLIKISGEATATDVVAGVTLYKTIYPESSLPSLTVGHNYNCTGVYVQFNDTKEMMPRKSDDIAEIVDPGKVATPTFDPEGGEFSEAQNVTISCATEDATIYYTIDGTDPTTESTTYSTAIAVSKTTTIKALAVKAEMTNSDIASATYTISAGGGEDPDNTVTFNYEDYKGQGGPSGTGSSYTMADKPAVSIGNDKFFGNNSYAHFYAGGTITITPATGVTITRIVLTASAAGYNGYQSEGSITASTGSLSHDGAVVTWTGSADAAFTLENDKQIRWLTIVVTYEEADPSAPSLAVDPTVIDFGDVEQGESVTAKTVAVNFANLTGAVTYSGLSSPFSASGSISTTGDEITISADATVAVGNYEQTLTVTSAADSKSATVTVTMNVIAPETGDKYVKVTEAPGDWSGEYLLVYENGTTAYVWDGTDGAESCKTATIKSGNKIAKPDGAAVVTIEAITGGYSLQISGGTNDGKYIVDNANNAALKFGDDAYAATITYETDWTEILFSQRCIRYNAASGQERFRYYAADGQQKVQLYKKEAPAYETVRSGLECGRHYTVCLEKNITAVKGATFWNLRYKNAASTVAYLELETVIEAGKPYIFQATADKLKVIYGEEVAGAPVANGALVGTFSGLTTTQIDEIIATDGDIYMLFNNELRPVTSGNGNYLNAHRAYVRYDLLQEEPAQGFAPGKKVKRMPMQGQTTTDCELINAAEAPVKMMINGQLYILRGEKKYDATGRLVK